MKKRTLFLILLLMLSAFAQSQLNFKERIEVELEDGYTDEEVFTFEESGFILSSKNMNQDNGKVEWRYEKYNTNLRLEKTESVLLKSSLKVQSTFVNKKHLYVFFKDLYSGDFVLLTVSSSNLKITETKGKVHSQLNVSEMHVFHDYLFLNAKVKKVAHLYSINLKTEQVKKIPIEIEKIKPKRIKIMSLQVMETRNKVFVYAKALISKKESRTYVVQLNHDGEMEDIFDISEGMEENIINISASTLKGDKVIFTGAFSKKNSEESEGFFVCLREGVDMKFTKLYSFLDLENFLSFLPERRQDRIQKRKKKKRDKGKELKENYRIVAHDVMEVDGEYVFLAEAYFPTYRSYTTTYSSMVNGTVVNTSHVVTYFAGYQYSHAFLVKFNQTGELIWDNVFEMWCHYKPMYVKRFISLSQEDEALKLAYATKDKIVYKAFDYDGKIVQESSSKKIETTSSDDEIKQSTSMIYPWYGNNFLVFGQQKIKKTKKDSTKKEKTGKESTKKEKTGKESTKKEKKRRKVLFFSKIEFNADVSK